LDEPPIQFAAVIPETSEPKKSRQQRKREKEIANQAAEVDSAPGSSK